MCEIAAHIKNKHTRKGKSERKMVSETDKMHVEKRNSIMWLLGTSLVV
jgi:hypothetical protein